MDMNKEREAFEKVFPCSVGTVLNEYGHYESQINQQDAMIQNISWVVWQAAIASAVPDGYVLVPKEPTAKMIDATWDHDDEILEMSHNTRNEFIYKTMIEAAQEQGHASE